ncbi:hypothetical protein LLG46_02290 [bacterium]|nr:hypothetical protein [bacterium]
MAYAQNTSVSVENSIMEIRRTVNRYSADGFSFTEESRIAKVEFKCEGRLVRIYMQLPDKNEERFRLTETGRERTSENAVYAAWEQECRRSYRALNLVIKAKLEAVESGITTFDEEFMAHIVLPNGRTVGQQMLQPMQEALSSGKMLALTDGFGVQQ